MIDVFAVKQTPTSAKDVERQKVSNDVTRYLDNGGEIEILTNMDCSRPLKCIVQESDQ